MSTVQEVSNNFRKEFMQYIMGGGVVFNEGERTLDVLPELTKSHRIKQNYVRGPDKRLWSCSCHFGP